LIGANFDGKIDLVRNDESTVDKIIPEKYDGFVISPGPKKPKDSGLSMEIIKYYYSRKPIFGVCLGFQCINEFFGGKTIRSDVPVHGKTSLIKHSGRGIFQNVPSPIMVARYHSLVIKLNSGDFTITSSAENGIIMAFEHNNFPVFGVQFHPESFLTDSGDKMIKNFLGYL